MKLVLLGGNASENKEWVLEIRKALKPYFDYLDIFEYEHWHSGKSIIDVELEVSRLSKHVMHLGSYIIFAKSAGSLVTSKAILDGAISPEKCIFVGVPLDWAESNQFDAIKWLKGVNIPTLIIQNSNDPFATSNQIESMLSENKLQNIELAVLPGDDHLYGEIDKIVKLVVPFTQDHDATKA